VEEENQVLCEGIYSHFASRFGHRNMKTRRKNKFCKTNNSADASIAQIQCAMNFSRSAKKVLDEDYHSNTTEPDPDFDCTRAEQFSKSKSVLFFSQGV
jgi:hypothetical protein